VLPDRFRRVLSRIVCSLALKPERTVRRPALGSGRRQVHAAPFFVRLEKKQPARPVSYDADPLRSCAL
jgi:hypothetical protein